MRALVAIGVAASAAVVVPAVRPAPRRRNRPPTARISVVRADVIVSDARGRPVENLQPSDFAIVENGVPQTLDAVRFVKIGRDAAAQGRRRADPIRVRRAGTGRPRRRAARGDSPRRISRERGEHRPRARHADALCRSRSRPARSGRRPEAARFAAHHPDDARPRPDSPRDRHVSGTPRRIRAAHALRTELHRRRAPPRSSRFGRRWRRPRSMRWSCTSGA